MGETEPDAADTVIRRRAPEAAALDRGRSATGCEPGDAQDTVIRLIEPVVPSRQRGDQLPILDTLSVRPFEDPRSGSAQTSDRTVFAVRVPGVDGLVRLDTPVVIGRRPGASRMPEHPAPQRIVVPADRAGVSGRHARIEQLGASVVVTDLGSRNGTVVHLPTGSQLRLRPGESCVVLPDSIVALGEGIDIVVVASPPASPQHDRSPA